jgi:hypothetical protein
MLRYTYISNLISCSAIYFDDCNRLLHTHHHLSSGTGTIGQTVVDVPSGLILTPPKEAKKFNNITYRNIELRVPIVKTIFTCESVLRKCKEITDKIVILAIFNELCN